MLPLLFMGGAVLYGGKKIIDANDKLDLAKKIDSEAKQLVEDCKSQAEEALDKTNMAISFLISMKKSVNDNRIEVSNYIKQIKNMTHII